MSYFKTLFKKFTKPDQIFGPWDCDNLVFSSTSDPRLGTVVMDEVNEPHPFDPEFCGPNCLSVYLYK